MSTRLERINTCDKCKFSELEQMGRYCHAKAPTSSPIIVPHPESQTGYKVGFYTCWPVVKDKEWCGEWKARVELAAGLPEAVLRGSQPAPSSRLPPQPSGGFVPGDAE